MGPIDLACKCLIDQYKNLISFISDKYAIIPQHIYGWSIFNRYTIEVTAKYIFSIF